MVEKKRGNRKIDYNPSKDIKILSYGLLVLILFSFLVGFVNLKQVITGHVSAIDIFSLGRLEGEGLVSQILIAKYVIFFTLIFFLYWAFDSLISEPKYNFVKFIISAGISWLSIAFLLKGEILTALTAYSALGILVMVGLPFIGVLLITSKLLTLKLINAQRLLVQRVIWGAYGSFLLYYLFTQTNMFAWMPWVSASPNKGSGFLAWIILAICAISFIFFFWNKSFIRMMVNFQKTEKELKRTKEYLKAAEMNEQRLIDAVTSKTREIANKMSGPGGNVVSKKTMGEIRNLINAVNRPNIP